MNRRAYCAGYSKMYPKVCGYVLRVTYAYAIADGPLIQFPAGTFFVQPNGRNAAYRTANFPGVNCHVPRSLLRRTKKTVHRARHARCAAGLELP